MNPPYFYDYRNAVNSEVSPSTVHYTDNRAAAYFARYLLQKAISVFKFKFPEGWDTAYCLYTLFCQGWFAVFDMPEFGVIPQYGSITGYDVFYRPSKVTITNPVFNGPEERTLRQNATLFRLMPDYGNIMGIVYYYAGMMATCWENIYTNLFNSKLAYVFVAKNKAVAQSFKAMYDKIASGEPSVVIDKQMLLEDGSVGWQAFMQNVGQNYIVDRLLADMRKIEQMFDTDIGVPNANTDKRERLISDEVRSNNTEVFSKASLWLETMRECAKEVEDMFGADAHIEIEWRLASPEGGAPSAEQSYSGFYGDGKL
jgi:hypothetical protein